MNQLTRNQVAAALTIALGLIFFSLSRNLESPEEQNQPEIVGLLSRVDGDGDPHDWPEWHRFRREEAKRKPERCDWNGCTETPTDLHHGIGARWCVMAGHPELVYSKEKGQWFLWLCKTHHKQAHDICDGCGGNWKLFNPDSLNDAKNGKWNSRGRSAWPFKTDREAIMWIKGRVERDD